MKLNGPPQYFDRINVPRVVASCSCARMAPQMTTAPWRPGMTIQAKILGAIAMSGLAALAMTSQANALTAQECSAKYQAAKTAGTLGGQKWNDFRKAQCGADATAAAPAAVPAAAPAAAPKEAKKKEAAPAKEAAAPAAPSGPAIYPSAVD